MNTHFKLAASLGLLVAGGALAACNGGDDSGSKGGYVDRDSDDIVTTGGTTGGTTGTDCEVTVSGLSPESGTTDVYYRDVMGVEFDEDASALSPTVSLTDSAGTEIGTSVEFDDTGFKAAITPTTPLEALTEYTLSVEVCENTSAVSFTTSEYGGSLDIEVSALLGSTFNFSLGDAEYTKPEGLGALLSSFLNAPLLIGIDATDGDNIHILGTQGREGDTEVEPDPAYDIWNFGNADVDGAYFKSEAANIEIGYDCATIPIYDFQLEGTFAADGTSIGGGSATGLGDSRNMGCLIGAGSDPAAICNYAAGFGFSCDTCPDGNPWCLTIEAWFLPAPVVEGVSLSLD